MNQELDVTSNGRKLGLAVIGVLVIASTFLFLFNFRKGVDVQIRGLRIEAELVCTPEEWAKGLSRRDYLDEGKGMLFVFEEAALQHFWMKDMRFAIDLIWINDGTVLGHERRMSPEIGVADDKLRVYSSPGPVRYVLEFSEGLAERFGIADGDAVSFMPVPDCSR